MLSEGPLRRQSLDPGLDPTRDPGLDPCPDSRADGSDAASALGARTARMPHQANGRTRIPWLAVAAAAAIACAVTTSAAGAVAPTAHFPAPAAGSTTETDSVDSASYAADDAAPDPVDATEAGAADPDESPADATEGTAASDDAADEPSTVVELDIDELIERLRGTRAIGVFTKLALRNDVESLIDETQSAVVNGDESRLPVLRSRFDGLVLKTVALLDGRDDELARDIYQAREFVWKSILEMQA